MSYGVAVVWTTNVDQNIYLRFIMARTGALGSWSRGHLSWHCHMGRGIALLMKSNPEAGITSGRQRMRAAAGQCEPAMSDKYMRGSAWSSADAAATMASLFRLLSHVPANQYMKGL